MPRLTAGVRRSWGRRWCPSATRVPAGHVATTVAGRLPGGGDGRRRPRRAVRGAPRGEDGARLLREADDLVAPAPATADGRTVLRLTPTAGAVTLVSSEQARRSVNGQPPDAD